MAVAAGVALAVAVGVGVAIEAAPPLAVPGVPVQIGRASCRERV